MWTKLKKEETVVREEQMWELRTIFSKGDTFDVKRVLSKGELRGECLGAYGKKKGR